MAETVLVREDDEVLSEMTALARAAKAEDFGTEADKKGNSEKSAPAAFLTLLEQFARFATGEDYIWNDPHQLYERAKRVWKSASIRKAGSPLIKVSVEQADQNPEHGSQAISPDDKRLVLTIVSDDRPFLVDSVTAALTEAGKSIRFFVNALTDICRDDQGKRTATGTERRESIIYAELDPPVDDAEISKIHEELLEVLNDVRDAVTDWEAMRQRLEANIEQLRGLALNKIGEEEQEEIIAFLNWLKDGHFSFLGVRRYMYQQTTAGEQFKHDPSGDLGILKNSKRRILKNTYSEQGDLSEAVETFLKSDEPILVAKANSKSLVHRRVYQDYIGVKLYNNDGKIIGEDRFIGLYTADAYNRPASDIPLLRRKVRAVLEEAPFTSGGHNEKALVNILETYPRDELFQADIATILRSSVDILRLYKRPRVKLIMRRDRFDRFISAFVYIPRDQFNSDRREAIGRLLADTYHGRISAFYPFFGDASLVRVHFIIGLDIGAPQGPGVRVLTQQINKICRDWNDDLVEKIRETHNGVVPEGLFDRYRKAFEAGYREHMYAEEAVNDIVILEQMKERAFVVRAYRLVDDAETVLRLKLYRQQEPIRLSEIIPTLENFGLSVIKEDTYKITPQGQAIGAESEEFWIHDFLMEENTKRQIDFDVIKIAIQDAMTAILNGMCEDDGFNALVVVAGLTWREAWMLRACAKHHLQAGFSFSQSYLEETLICWPDITKLLVSAFHAKFRDDERDINTRQSDFQAAYDAVIAKLDQVTSLDQDRIVRRFLRLFSAVTRTNFYQRIDDVNSKPCIVFKIDSNRIEELPEPKPYREIFVSGPAVDGVHLRFGPVARGGLRWSDRKEDFRTEVLGLVKAQRVKNAVIVPNGSKGGFFPKQLPITDDRNIIYEAGRDAYKLFIAGLLDVTDNIVDGEVLSPAGVVCHDAPDPYLVVAADKGTAQFSDTANAISQEYGFWLGDAFASGGSVGYDHKVMGITARGAWEAVKRHFREKGKDIQSETFTVAGVGDMSGDVFGNGMLLSENIQLVAAFDHRDIFIDPAPDVQTSFAERKRLFELPRSSWQDYDQSLISQGGGVFSRSSKSIELTSEIQSLLDTQETHLPPTDLIQLILKSRVELFWLGGIGTYFKAAGEENWHVGDRANDSVRINADEMRMQVIGEGANLGLTQKARISYAARGGAVNTDAIDNSAGVDSSDHEVNIKILLREAIEQKALPQAERNDLLAEMTDDVARLVLIHNYDQTRALTQLQITSVEDLGAQSRFLSWLEDEGRIDREVEDLPSREAMEAMREQGRGLTRPELSVLMAYAKLWLFDEIVDSGVPDDVKLHYEVLDYFPEALHQFPEAIERHRLRREIIATRMANEVVDTCGASFVHEAVEVTGASVEEIILAYEAARQVYDLKGFGRDINMLDNKIPAQTQNALYFEGATLLKEQVYRLVTDINAMALLNENGLTALIDHYKDAVVSICDQFMVLAPADAADSVSQRTEKWQSQGAPEKLARQAALFPALERAFDVVDITRETQWRLHQSGSLFFAVARTLKLDQLREQIRMNPPLGNFDSRATRRLMDEVTRQQKALTLNIIAYDGKIPEADDYERVQSLMASWLNKHQNALARYHRFADEIDVANQAPTVAKLSLLSRQLSELAERTRVHP